MAPTCLLCARIFWFRAPGKGMLLSSPTAWRSMSFMAVSLALLRVFGIGFFSLGFVVITWPVARRTVGVDLRVHWFITEVLGPVVVVDTTIDIFRPPRLTSALFNIKPPPLFMRVLTGKTARMFAESTRLGSVLSPWCLVRHSHLLLLKTIHAVQTFATIFSGGRSAEAMSDRLQWLHFRALYRGATC